MTLAQLRAALAEKLKGITSLRDKAFAAEATEADTQALTDGMAEIKSIEDKIATAESIDAMIARNAAPIEPANDPVNPVAAQAKKNLTPGQKFGLALTSIISAHHAKSTPMKELEDRGFGSVVKELITTTPSAGGYAVPKVLHDEIIEILREDSAFIAGGPRKIHLAHGNMNLAAGDVGVTGGYGAEATDIVVEQETFREVNLQAKRLAVIVPASNELLDWSLGNMEEFIRADTTGALGEYMDINLLRGTGLANSPLGITNIVGGLTFAATAAGATKAETIERVENDLAKAETMMRLRKVRGRKAAWIMSPAVAIFLSSLRDGNGNLAYPTMNYGPDVGGPTLRGKRVLTGQIPTNLGATTDQTEVYLVDFDHVLFGQTTEGIQFRVSDEASYKVSGEMYSAFQRNVTLLRAMHHHDADVRHIGAVVKITGVHWMTA